MRRKSKTITVDFTPSKSNLYWLYRRAPQVVIGRQYGGSGILHRPSLYAGPPVIILQGRRGGHDRVFHAVYQEWSPTGHTGGSFRINELKGDKIVTRGYTCSWPDFDACIRVAAGSTII